MTAEDGAQGPTLAEKIDRLFRAVRSPDGNEYTFEEASQAIRAKSGVAMSDTYLWELRRGVKTNPRMKHIESLAIFFGVPVNYFFDEPDGESARIYERLAMLPAYDDDTVQRIALRAVDLSPEALRTITEVIEYARQREGLQDGRRERDDTDA